MRNIGVILPTISTRLDFLRRMRREGDLKFCLRVTLLAFQRARERVWVCSFFEERGVDCRETICRGGNCDTFGDDCAKVYGTLERGMDGGTGLGWT
jgi:hypothetical protein